MKISFKEIYELAKAGYKPGEIAELIELQKSTQVEAEEEPKEEPEEEPKEDPEEEPKEEPKDEPDYKKLYEESLNKISEMQQANLRQNAKPAMQNDEDILISKIRDFM